MSYRVTASSLRIRSGPGTTYEEVGTINGGEIIDPVETSGWVPVLLDDNNIGWLAKEYLQEVQAAAGEPETTESAPGPTPEPAAAAPGEYDFSTKEATIAAIRAECQKQGIGLPEQVAYVLATTEWETGHTFKPVREAYYISKDFDTAEAWRRKNLRYYPYYGRGLSQLTWLDNYRKYSPKLTQRFGVPVDLVNNPDDVLRPDYAVFILVDGFKTGAFTGKKITDYINAASTNFINARRCINGLDRAEEIAKLAEEFLAA